MKEFKSLPWITVTLLVAIITGGCDEAGEAAADRSAAPAPAHPGMRAPPSGRPPAPENHSHGGSGLPAGHPPVGGPTSGAPGSGAPSAPAGGAAAGGQEVSSDVLLAGLAQFGIKAVFPSEWRLEAGRGMRLGTVRLPRNEGDSADGEMSIIPAAGSI